MHEEIPTTRDAFLDGRVQARQPEKGFRSGLEAVFLAAACPARAGDAVLEAGCGAGVASLCLLSRVAGIAVTGVEADAALSALSKENASANGFSHAFLAANVDVTGTRGELQAAGLKPEAHDHAIANPPFYETGAARISHDERKARSRVMAEGGLDAWLRFLAGATKPGGTATVIHTVKALPLLLRDFEGRFGGIRVIPLYPKPGLPAVRIIAVGIKGSRAPLTLEPGIVIHELDGRPTAAAQEVLREGRGLFGNR